jgi:SAM-dependent methyltransferase
MTTTDATKVEARFSAVARSKTFMHIVRTYSLGEKRVLDIGCSYGEFLTHFGRGSVGLTIDPGEVAYGQSRGLDIRLANIEEDEIDVPEKQFDVIFANNIFEHLLAPHLFLIKVRKYLADDGVLILGVPCIPKLTFLLRFAKFRGSMATLHINFFTRDTLMYTVARGGWRVRTTRSFHAMSRLIDMLFDLIAPHFYVIADVDRDFSYHPKRMKELAGYSNEVIKSTQKR